MIKPKVLFLCSDNSCRTQMAEAFLRAAAGDRFVALSAGAEASELDPYAVDAMREVGIDISGQVAKRVDQFLSERVAYLITLCDRKIENECPIFPGAVWRLEWPIRTPLDARDREERRTLVRLARDEIQARVIEFVEAHG